MSSKFEEIIFRGSRHFLNFFVNRLMGHFYTLEDPIFSTYRPIEPLSWALMQKIEEFHSFDVAPVHPFETPPLTKTQQIKVNALLQKPTADISKEILEGIKSLKKMCERKNATRQDFTVKEWKAIDYVNFVLIKEQMKKVFGLFLLGYGETNQKTWAKIHVSWKEATIAEILARALAFVEGLHGEVIEIPTVFQDESLRVVAYEIRQTYVGDRLPCYVLTSTEPSVPAWLIIRGSEFNEGTYQESDGTRKEFREGSRESLFADFLDSQGIGHLAVLKAMDPKTIYADAESGFQNLDQIINETLANKKLIVAGHSLGGCIANSLAIYYPKRITKCYAFNSPGLSKKTAQLCKPEMIDRLISFGVHSDLVTESGRTLVGRYFITEGKTDFIESHLCYLLSLRNGAFFEIDNFKENHSFSRMCVELIRRLLGFTFKLRFKKPDWWIHR